jgi:hypothetical protein
MRKDISMLHAYIDESGQRGLGTDGSDHFIMTAVVIRSTNAERTAPMLASLRSDLKRQPEHTLSWKHLKTHEQRLHACQTLATNTWMKTITVVVCKRHIGTDLPDDGSRYLYTMRLLLERLSWLARDEKETVSYTLAHIIRMKIAQVRKYEQILQRMKTEIVWSNVANSGGSFSTPEALDELQIADFVASATATAFEPDNYGNTERRYLDALRPLIWRRGNGAMTSYGMKMHPWSESTKAAYPWVAAL